MGECVLEVIGSPSRLKLTRKGVTLVLPTFDFNCEQNVARRKWKSPLVGSGS
jgi:hypothetical protein